MLTKSSMNPKELQASPRSRIFKSRRNFLWILLAITVLAIVIPIAVMFGKKKKASSPKSDVLVPLYVYPAPGAWEPLFNAIVSHPELNFTVVVNPASGPGAGDGPDGNYTKEIPRLNSYTNVRTVGYVSTDYTKRDIELALQDISTYAAWSANATAKGIGMHGIFLDETPSQYDIASAEYYGTIASAVRGSSGLGEEPLIIHNPGAIPDARFLASCDLTVVFEGTYSTYQIYGMQEAITTYTKQTKHSRDAFACIIHGLPPTLSSKDLESFVRDLRRPCGGVFVTGLSVDYYASFWAGWDTFLEYVQG